MSQPETNRNLLFAIMAVQMDFVPRDAMFSAMVAWTERKATPLGQILVDRGELSPGRRSALDVLIDEHIKAHANDPARSLQALSSTDGVAEILTRVPDAQLQASLGHLRDHGRTQMGSDSPSDLATMVPSAVEPLAPWTGRFRVVRKHAEGGLGIVSVAIDDELDREVAFKEIKPRHADRRDSQARFVMEAEITGKLEHPGIVPIYGLGHDPMGRPYYAMRFIRGDSLADAINRFHDPNGPYTDPTKRALQLRELLARFLDVCDALSYAHSRGVLHRDLKPGNVMLGPFGETLVVDWGLAMPLDEIPHGVESTHGPLKTSKTDSGSLPSEKGVVVGTPHYMPPEQANGDLDQLGPRSDVYGLGAILYDLLTGHHPVSGDTSEEVLAAVRAGRITPPHKVLHDIPRALEAICLKALSVRPVDRYANPNVLATEIKAWLADERVSAHSESLLDLARRWARRHRVLVSGVSAAMIVGLIGLVAVVAIQTRARADLDQKNRELNTRNLELAESNQALIEQRHRAVDRERRAIDAVKKFRDTIVEEPILKEDRFKTLRARLLQPPLSFFRSLRERMLSDEETLPESLERLADASSTLASLTSEIGDKSIAIEAYRESLRVYERLRRGHKGEDAYKEIVSNINNNIGILLYDLGRSAEAIEAYRVGQAIRRSLAVEYPDRPEYQVLVAESHGNLGIVLGATGNSAAARQEHEAAQRILKGLVASKPDVILYRQALSLSQASLGILLVRLGLSDEAISQMNAALAIRKSLAETDPDNLTYRTELGFIYHNLGTLYFVTGRAAEALDSSRTALAIRKAIAESNPAMFSYQRSLAETFNVLGAQLARVGRSDEALASHRAAMNVLRKLAAEDPNAIENASILGATINNLALLEREAKRFSIARTLINEAIEWQHKALVGSPRNPQYRQFMNNHLVAKMLICQDANDASGVVEARRELDAFLESDPNLRERDDRLGEIVKGGKIRDIAERLQLARHAYDRSLHALAARLWDESLNEKPELANDRMAQVLYNAACSAALSGTGQGKDRPSPSKADRSRLRAKALEWLRDELRAWERALDSGHAQGKLMLGKTLLHWTKDTDLAGVREPAELAKLPEAERKEWEGLWKEVERVRAKAK